MTRKQRTASAHIGNFGSIVRCLFKILQCMHHRAISIKQSEGHFTKAFRTKLTDLDKFIRPAQTNSNLQQQLRSINQEWACTVSKCLSSHYEEQQKLLFRQIQTLVTSTNILDQAKSVALRWGRKNFGSKLQQQTVLAFESLLAEFRLKHQIGRAHV